MMHRTSGAARMSVATSRASPSRAISLCGVMLALSVAAGTAGGQAANASATASLAVTLPLADSGKTPADSAASTTKAAAALPKWFDEIAVNAFVSTAYIYNANRPATGTNSYRVFDFNDNSFNLDVAELVVQIAPSKPNDAGFRVDFTAGNSIPQIAKSQDQTVAQFDLQQAFVSYIAPIGSGLRFDVGKYITHMGYEVIEGYDGYNDNYSRSILFGYAIPFTHTGVKASYAFSSKVAAMVGVVNGWDSRARQQPLEVHRRPTHSDTGGTANRVAELDRRAGARERQSHEPQRVRPGGDPQADHETHARRQRRLWEGKRHEPRQSGLGRNMERSRRLCDTRVDGQVLRRSAR